MTRPLRHPPPPSPPPPAPLWALRLRGALCAIPPPSVPSQRIQLQLSQPPPHVWQQRVAVAIAAHVTPLPYGQAMKTGSSALTASIGNYVEMLGQTADPCTRDEYNEMAQAINLRSICVKVIIQVATIAINNSAKDSSSYVRKAAAHAIGKVFALDSASKELHLQRLQDFVSDLSTQVLGSDIAAFEEMYTYSFTIPSFTHITDGYDLPRLAGWWGHDRKTRFAMPRDFVPQRGAPGFQLSNPPVLAIVPVAEAAKLFEKEGGMGVVRRKSVRLTGFFERLLEERLSDAVEVVTPRDVDRRGAQLSLVVERVRRWEDGDMHAFNERLEKRGVVCDVREPDVLRVAPAPLYNSFMDVVRFVEVLEQVLQEISDSG